MSYFVHLCHPIRQLNISLKLLIPLQDQFPSYYNSSCEFERWGSHTYLQSIYCRILQTNSFSGKMNALNEVNKLIMSLNTIQRSTINRSEEPESLTADKLIVRKLLIKNVFI